MAFIERELADNFDGPTVIVPHHAPHPLSIHPKYLGSQVSPAFSSDLSTLVERSGAALWIHGHMHDCFDYMVGGTRVVCNPKGYGPHTSNGRLENVAFDARLVIEV